MKTDIVGTPKGIGKEALHIGDVIHWVAISDKLPPQEDNVLTYTEKGEIHVGKYRGTFWIVGNQFSFDMGEPTHWAKLPKPPCV